MIAEARVSAASGPHGRLALDDGRDSVAYDELAALVEEEADWLASHGERF